MMNGNVHPDKKFCLACKKKTPPIETILKLGMNINDHRWNHSAWYCNDCHKEMQKGYRDFQKGKFTQYERIKEEEDIQQFEKEWNDPEFKNVKEISDKMVKVWNKFHRREPKSGLTKDVCCSVMFKNYWYVTATQIVEDMINSRNDTTMIQNRHKEILLLYIPSVIDAFRDEYRQKARNKWDGLIDAVNSKYVGTEKLVATPFYEDPKTKRNEKRWYLLSYDPELKERNERNLNKKTRIDYNMNQEAIIVEGIGQREEEITAKSKHEQKESNTNNNDNRDE